MLSENSYYTFCFFPFYFVFLIVFYLCILYSYIEHEVLMITFEYKNKCLTLIIYQWRYFLSHSLQFLDYYIVFSISVTHNQGYISDPCSCCSLCLKCSTLRYLCAWLTAFKLLVKCHFVRDAFSDCCSLRWCTYVHLCEHTHTLTHTVTL